MSRETEKTRTAFWIENELLQRCDHCWKSYGFSSRNEFVNRAIEDYIASQTLARMDDAMVDKLAAAIAKATDEGVVKISKGLFRYSVNQEILMHLIADGLGVTADEIEKLRGQAIRNVQKTKGKVNLETIANFHDG